MRIVGLSAALMLGLSGCGAFVPVVDMRALPPETMHQVQGISIYDDNKLSMTNYDILGIIEGHSCQNKTWDPPATRTAAVQQLRYYAWEMGANGLSEIRCDGREGTSVHTNCWELISCTANAIKAK